MIKLTVYSRAGCHLCEVMIEELLPLVRGRAEVEVVDIDSKTELRERYDVRVPVLAMGNRELCQHRLDRDALETALYGNGKGA